MVLTCDEASQVRVVSRFATGEIYKLADAKGGGDLPSNLAVCETSDRYIVSVPIVSDSLTEDVGYGHRALVEASEGFDAFVFDFDDMRTMHLPTVCQGGPVLSGGVPAIVDHHRCCEAGFHTAPVVSNSTTYQPSGGKLTGSDAADYSAKIVYKWIDQRGVVHRSIPSLPVVHSFGAPYADDYYTFDAFPLTLTERWDADCEEFPVWIELYRTVANGTTYYLEHEYENVREDYVITVEPGKYATDDDIQAREVLYTDGGVMPNWQPPAARHIVAHRTWLWMISAERATEIWISKDTSDWPRAPGWDPYTRVIRHDVDGEFVALAPLDEKLLCFKRTTIYALVGTPDNDMGQGGQLDGPVQLSVECGCIDARSVVSCPAGVVFQAQDGLYVIGRGLDVQLVSAPITDTLEAYPVVTSAVYDAARGLVLVSLSDATKNGVTAAWDHASNEWVIWHLPTVGGGADSMTWSSCMASRGTAGTPSDAEQEYHLMQGTASVLYLDDDDRTDDTGTGDGAAMVVSSAWVQFAGVQGFQKIRKLQLLGTWLSAHSLQVDLYFDHSATAAATITRTPAQVTAALVGSREQLEIHIARKCEAMRVKVTATPEAKPAKCVRWEAMSLQIGVVTGLFRLHSEARG